MTITSQQFNTLATKKDLEKFVTKKDLKKDLEKMATKKDLKKDLEKLEEKMDEKFASKKDLSDFQKETNEKFNKAFEVFASKEDLKEIRQEMATKKDIDRILSAVDGITKQSPEFDIGFAMNQGAHDRFEKKIIKVDKRVGVIEKKLK